MDRISDLILFLKVLDTGSITAAARNMDLSVALASQRLKRLEESLGIRLFHRTTRKLQITTEGQALAEQGRPLIEDLEALTTNLRGAARGLTGTLRVTAPAGFGQLYISRLVPQFLQQHPGLQLQLDLSDAMVDLVSQGFDLAIRIGRLEDSNLVARKLASNQRILCAAPSYLRKRGVPRHPSDLEQHDCLLLTSRAPADVWSFRSQDGEQISVRVRGPLRSSHGEVIHDAVLAGMGIALHSTWHVCDDLRAGRLRQVLSDFPLPDSGIFALTPQRRLVLPRVRAFVAFLLEHFSPVAPWERHLPQTAGRARGTVVRTNR